MRVFKKNSVLNGSENEMTKIEFRYKMNIVNYC